MSVFKCHICGSETARDDFVDEVLEVDGRRVLVEHIPAQVCARCGEPVFSRETTERIRALVHGAGQPVRTVPLDVFQLTHELKALRFPSSVEVEACRVTTRREHAGYSCQLCR